MSLTEVRSRLHSHIGTGLTTVRAARHCMNSVGRRVWISKACRAHRSDEGLCVYRSCTNRGGRQLAETRPATPFLAPVRPNFPGV